MKMVEIGVITTTHGIKGELKIKELSDFDRFKVNEEMFIIYDDKEIKLTVERARPQKNILIVKFKEFGNINEVLSFRGLSIYSNVRGKLESNEYYFEDLLGLKAYTNLDEYIGDVINIIELPHGHLLEVRNNDKKSLIPLEKEFIIEVTDNKIIIKPIEGLL